jgi:hypothetical protein
VISPSRTASTRQHATTPLVICDTLPAVFDLLLAITDDSATKTRRADSSGRSMLWRASAEASGSSIRAVVGAGRDVLGCESVLIVVVSFG